MAKECLPKEDWRDGRRQPATREDRLARLLLIAHCAEQAKPCGYDSLTDGLRTSDEERAQSHPRSYKRAGLQAMMG